MMAHDNDSLKFIEVKQHIIVTQHIKMDQSGQKFKFAFWLFPKWLFFQLDFGENYFDIGHYIDTFLRYGSFIDDIITDQWKVDFEKVSESLQSIGVQAVWKPIFTWKDSFYIKSFKQLGT